MWHITSEEKPEVVTPEDPEVVEKPQELTRLELAILELEECKFRYQGTKEKAILELGLRPIQYYQCVNNLADDPRAEEVKPALVKRIKERRGY